MKKYVVSIIIIGLTLGTFLVYSIMKIQKANTNEFYDSGYILKSTYQSGQAQNVERYYFNANAPYQTKYNQKVIFDDTNGDEVVTDKYNFVHYTNGSISALEKGVILNLAQIEEEPITYYNLNANRVVKKSGSEYIINNVDKDLKFENFIWKISSDKYLVVGNPINIVFNDGTTKTVNGFVEIKYMDNEIIKIYNQEVTYQTISSKVYLEMPDDIKINLGNKIVSKNNENKMSLENMVINSEDNVEIVDLDEYAEETDENNTQNETENTTNETNNENNEGSTNNITTNINNNNETNINNNTNINNQTNINNNGNNNTQNNETNNNTQNNTDNNTTNNNNTGDNIDLNNPNGNPDDSTDENTTPGDTINPDDTNTGTETEVEETPAIIEPVFKIETFEVNSIGVNTQVIVEDEDNLITGNINIKIVQNNTGKTVYEDEREYGTINIDVNVATLLPDTEYTLMMESTYQVEDIEYTKNFIYKIFRTEFVGIDFEKDYFTNDKMVFKVNIEKESKVTSANLVILDSQGEVLQNKIVEKNAIENIAEFVNLNSNTEYTVKIIDVLYDDQVITNGFELSRKYKTLKNKPTISGAEFEIDKRNATFKLNLNNVVDYDKGMIEFRYEVYDLRQELKDQIPIYSTKLTRNEQVTIKIDDIKFFRGVPYTYKVVAVFNDNEKIVEYESEYSTAMIMEGVKFPTIRFEEQEVTFERIKGNLIIEDNSNTIKLDDTNKIIVTYTDSVGITKSFTTQGSLTIPIDINNLRSNETYKFSVYTRIDLQDNNDPIDECYIGGAVVKTKTPENMIATFVNIENDVVTPFSVRMQLTNSLETGSKDDKMLEALTLSGMTFSIYAGQEVSGTPIKTVKLVDTNIEPYQSNLKEQYYDQSMILNPTFFGAINSDFKEKYYTIAVTDAYDYTEHQNKLPIIENKFTVKTNGYIPDLPTDVNNAIDVTVVRNRDKGQRSDLNSDTIVGYRIKASYDNNQLLARKITYHVYDETTKNLITTKEIIIEEDGIIPECEFDVLDGTSRTIEDIDAMRRGNSYYFTYEIDLDLNNDGIPETKYPYQVGGEEVVLSSKKVEPAKQEAKFLMYPSTSTANKIVYKYNFTDIDKTLDDNNMRALIGTTIRDTKPINNTKPNTFETIEFSNLVPGDFKISVTHSLSKTQLPTKRELVAHHFDGEITLNEVNYNIRLESNRLIITLLNATNKQNQISSITAEFISGDIIIRKEFLKLSNGIAVININDLEGLLDKQTTVNVYAYYDSGLIGFDMEAKHIALEKAYTSGMDKYYYAISQNNNLVESPTLGDNVYIHDGNYTNLRLTQVSGNAKDATVSLKVNQNGMNYGYDVILQKQIKRTQLTSDGSNIIYFDKIIPGITLRNSNQELNLRAELDRLIFRPKIIYTNKIGIQNNDIFIDIYTTDSNGRNEEFLRTETRKVEEFENSIEIDNLMPKRYYFIKFRTNIVKTNGTIEEVELYDVDTQITGEKYYFSTLANVEISNLNVEYKAVNYNEKTIDITYQLGIILGYQKITYTIYEYNEQTMQYEEILQDEDTLLKRDMKKQINANPKSMFKFNKKYKVKLIPLAVYTSLEGVEQQIELGIQELEFELKQPTKPIIAIRSEREGENIRKFKITVYDENRIIENDKYTLRILDDRQLDITPEEYKGKEFSTDVVNNTISVNVNKYKEYTIELQMKLDYDNDAIDLSDYIERHISPAINESGIAIGNITVSTNPNLENKFDLIFNNSYNLLEVEKMRYSIYNTNGYAINGTMDFVPTQVTDLETTYYVLTMNESVAATGNYYIELQFLKNDEIVETASLEYTYIE